MKKVLLFIFVSILLGACQKSNPNFQQDAANPEFLIRAELMLTESIIHDIFPFGIYKGLFGRGEKIDFCPRIVQGV
jgi:hypothetical protein